MSNYELVVIFKGQLNKEALDSEIEKMQANIANCGGTVSGVENWGRREIAFLMNNEKYGQYVNITFSSDNPKTVEKINNLARITESLLKFQVHRLGKPARKFKGNPLRLKNPIQTFEDDDQGDDYYSNDSI